MEKIDGNAIAETVIEELREEVAALDGSRPVIQFFRVGEDPASVSYVNKKQKTAERIGIDSRLRVFEESATEAELWAAIAQANADPAIHGILVQAPLPGHMRERETFNQVHPDKDVDGFSSQSLGRLVQEDPGGFTACTPSGIVEICARAGVETAGKQVVIVGRSLIVGKPAALLFMRKHAFGNATVSVGHSRTADLPALTRQADILVAAIGKPRFITASMVKPGATIIDVGINRIADPTRKSGYRLVGDVDFEDVSSIVGKITPVPGGVGPMTVAMLMRNTVRACKRAQSRADGNALS